MHLTDPTLPDSSRLALASPAPADTVSGRAGFDCDPNCALDPVDTFSRSASSRQRWNRKLQGALAAGSLHALQQLGGARAEATLALAGPNNLVGILQSTLEDRADLRYCLQNSLSQPCGIAWLSDLPPGTHLRPLTTLDNLGGFASDAACAWTEVWANDTAAASAQCIVDVFHRIHSEEGHPGRDLVYTALVMLAGASSLWAAYKIGASLSAHYTKWSLLRAKRDEAPTQGLLGDSLP